MRLLKAIQKSFKFNVSIEPYIYAQPNEIMKENNFIECLYYGKASFSGSFSQQVEGIFSLKVVEIENVLMDIFLLNAAKEQFCSDDDSIEKVKAFYQSIIDNKLSVGYEKAVKELHRYHYMKESNNKLRKIKRND